MIGFRQGHFVSTPKLSRDQLSLVSNNLQNIFVAAHDSKPSIELVPALFGKRLYYPRVGWRGRVLCVLHACIALILGDGFIKKKLKDAIVATQECFEKLEGFRHNYHDSVFQDYLTNRFKDLPSKFSKKEIQNARKEILVFYNATYPLTQLVKRETNAKINDFLKVHFNNLLDIGESPFYHEPTFKTVKDFVRIMAIEGYAKDELPLSLFRKISENENGPKKNLDKAEEKILQSFVGKMLKAKKQGMFQIELFHKAMKSIINFLKNDQKENGFDLKQLELTLIKNNCNLLQEFAKKQIDWRQKLKKGDQFLADNEPFYFLNNENEKHHFELGDLLKSSKKKEDFYQVYEIYEPYTLKKYEDFLMIIGPNNICLEYRDLMRFESFWGLETPKMQYIHPKGQYAIVEKLYSIESINWKSIGELDQEDQKQANSLQALIRFFIREKNSPKDLKAEYLKLDVNGNLKSIKDFIPCGSVDYIALEEVSFKIAQEKNLAIYHHLIKPLKEAAQGKKLLKFFRKAVSSAVENRFISIEFLAKRYRIMDQKVIARARELQIIASQIKKECEEVMFSRYHSFDKDKLRTQISKSMLSFYEKDKTFGRFWNGMQSEKLIEEIEKDLVKLGYFIAMKVP